MSCVINVMQTGDYVSPVGRQKATRGILILIPGVGGDSRNLDLTKGGGS